MLILGLNLSTGSSLFPAEPLNGMSHLPCNTCLRTQQPFMKSFAHISVCLHLKQKYSFLPLYLYLCLCHFDSQDPKVNSPN